MASYGLIWEDKYIPSKHTAMWDFFFSACVNSITGIKRLIWFNRPAGNFFKYFSRVMFKI